MKIAYFTYPSAFQNVGGGEILLLKMKEYVEKEGLKVDLFDMWRSQVEDYDWIHVFGSVKDCLGLIRVANARKVKVAITPLIWSDWRRALFSDDSFATKLDFLARHFSKVVYPSFPSARRKLLVASDLIFPNSEMEKRHITRLFAVPEAKMRVVHNGADEWFLNAEPSLFHQRFGGEPFLLGVGRIEPRKNQLNLIKAVSGIPGKKLILIGSPVAGYERYYEDCRRTGSGFTEFIPTLPHGDVFLKSAYAACELFVLQGWFETPGLVAMEAALAGARVVATVGGSTREYFGDFVDYFDPSNPSDIRNKIVRNLACSQNDGLKEHVLNHFTWDKIARETIRSYQEVSSA